MHYLFWFYRGGVFIYLCQILSLGQISIDFTDCPGRLEHSNTPYSGPFSRKRIAASQSSRTSPLNRSTGAGHSTGTPYFR